VISGYRLYPARRAASFKALPVIMLGFGLYRAAGAIKLVCRKFSDQLGRVKITLVITVALVSAPEIEQYQQLAILGEGLIKSTPPANDTGRSGERSRTSRHHNKVERLESIDPQAGHSQRLGFWPEGFRMPW
jgi:hypothetical protein